eukprot:1179604-Prorocentrum_minimum.AAC.2
MTTGLPRPSPTSRVFEVFWKRRRDVAEVGDADSGVRWSLNEWVDPRLSIVLMLPIECIVNGGCGGTLALACASVRMFVRASLASGASCARGVFRMSARKCRVVEF